MPPRAAPKVRWTYYLLALSSALLGVGLLFPVLYQNVPLLGALHAALPSTVRTLLALGLLAVGPILWRVLQRDDRSLMRGVGDMCLTLSMLVLLFGFTADVVYERFVLNSRYDWAFVFTKWAPEAGLTGVPVSVSQGEQVVAVTTTDRQGTYCFDDLRAGSYQVSTTGLPAYTPTTQLPLSVLLEPGSASTANQIGLQREPGIASWFSAWSARLAARGQAHARSSQTLLDEPAGSLCGVVFGDNNRNGTWQGEGRECSGWLWCGLRATIQIAAASLLLALFLGVIAGTGRTSKNALVNGISTAYVQIFRNTPLVVQLFLWFVGTLQLLRLFHVELALILSPFLAGVLGLGFYTGSYMSEAVRAGILSVDRGQWEAAHAIALTPLQTLRLIVLPQAFRIVVPPMTSQIVNLWKNSTVVMTVGVTDLLFQAREIGDRESHVFEILTAAVIIYVIGTLLLSSLMNYVNYLVSAERRRVEGAEPDRIRRVLGAVGDWLSRTGQAISRQLDRTHLTAGEQLLVLAAVVGLAGYVFLPWVEGLLAQQFLNVPPAPALTQVAAIGPNWANLSAGRDVAAEAEGFDAAYVAAPAVVLDQGLFKQWYSGYDGEVWRIGYAESGDGVRWRKARAEVAETGTTGTLESAVATGPAQVIVPAAGSPELNAAAPAVLSERAGAAVNFRMWFAGRDNPTDFWHLRTITSTDGLGWSPAATVALTPTAGSWDKAGIWSPAIVADGNRLRLWYAGSDGQTWAIGTATSRDGLQWEKYAGNPVLHGDTGAGWDRSGVVGPAVIMQPDGSYTLIYLGTGDGATWRVGRAHSADGLVWIKEPEPVPDLSTQTLPGDVPPAPAAILREGVYRLWLDQPPSTAEGQHIGPWSQNDVKYRYRFVLILPPLALLGALALIALRRLRFATLRTGLLQTILVLVGLAPLGYLVWLILRNNARDVTFGDIGAGAWVSAVALLVIGAAVTLDLVEREMPHLVRREVMIGVGVGLVLMVGLVLLVGQPPYLSLLNRGVPVDFGLAWSSIPKNLPFFLFGQPGQLGGLELTFLLAVVAIFVSFFLGTLLGAMRLSKYSFIKWPSVLYIELIRGTPLLMLIFYMHLSLPLVVDGLSLAPWQAGLIALTAFTASYIAEITRAGIQSIDRGQWEAAHSLGLNYPQTLRLIILPQATKRMIPPTVSQFIALFKDTSLIFVIGAIEFFRAIVVTYQREVQEGIGSTLPLLLFAAAVYFVFAFLMSTAAESLRKRMGAQERTT